LITFSGKTGIVPHGISADGSDQKKELHVRLLKIQGQIAGTFIRLDHEGDFEDIRETISLLRKQTPKTFSISVKESSAPVPQIRIPANRWHDVPRRIF